MKSRPSRAVSWDELEHFFIPWKLVHAHQASYIIKPCRNYSPSKIVAKQGLVSLSSVHELACPPMKKSILPLKKAMPRFGACFVMGPSRWKSLPGNWPSKGKR